MLQIGKIHNNIKIIENYYLLQIKLDSFFAGKPGQFIEIKIRKGLTPFLRRPFSIFFYNKDILEILYKVVGEGTELLSRMRIGEEIDILGPLGKNFSFTDVNSLLVAGGTGIGGIYYLTKYLTNYRLIFGVNTDKEKDEFNRFLNNDRAVCISMETEGTVVDYILGNNIKADYIYSCGPEIMMKNLYENYMKKNNITGEFSLESHMGCGIGVCMGCVRKIRRNNKIDNLRVCKEGPVFGADDIIWE